MDWFTQALAVAKDPDTRFYVITLVLILVIDRRLLRIVKSLEHNTSEVVHFAEHNTSRMQEIRDALYRLVGWPIEAPTPHRQRSSGVRRGDKDNVSGPQ